NEHGVVLIDLGSVEVSESGYERGGNDAFDLCVGHAEVAETKGRNGGAVSGDGLHLKFLAVSEGAAEVGLRFKLDNRAEIPIICEIKSWTMRRWITEPAKCRSSCAWWRAAAFRKRPAFWA